MPSTETISNNTHQSSGDNSIENFHSPSTTTTTTTTISNNTTSITSASPTAAGGCNHITTTSSHHHHDLQADEYSSPSSPPSPLSSSGGSTGLQQVWATHGSQALWKYKLNDLKNELKIKGLNVTGNKPNIINRLHSQYMAELSQQQQQQNGGGSQFVSPQQQQSSSSLDDHGDKSEQTPSSCSPPSSPMTTTVSTTVVAAVAATSTTTSANSAATVASTLTNNNNNNNNSSSTSATTVAASTTTGMTTLPSKVTTIAPQTHVVKPPSRLPPFMPMSSIHSAAAGGSFYPTMPIAPPSRPKILVKPPSVIIPPPPAPSSSSTALNARNAASLATAATTTTTEKSSVAMNGVGSGSVLPRNPTISAPTANTASLTTATSLQKTSSLSARRRMAQKGVSVKSNKPALSASAAVLMQMTDTPMSPQAPKTRLSALKAKPPSIIMPKPMTPLSDQSKYMTFSPHSSAQFLPFQNSSSSISRALKRKAGTRLPQFSSSSSHLLSSSTTGKPSKMMVAAKKVMMKSSSSSADQNQQIKKRGRPSHKGKTLSQDHIPTDLISLGPSRSSSISSYGMVKTIDYGSTSGIGSHHHHHHYHNTSPIRSRNEDSLNTDSESESDMDNCLDYLVGSDDENYTMSSHNDSSTSYQASESVATTAPDYIDSIVPTREVNLIEDYIENVPNRKRALLDDTDFYGDVSYSTDASPYKRRKSDDVFGGAEEEEEDEEFDEEPFFFCGTTQEVPESIAESNLMEQTMGALQSEYSFEVSLAKNKTSSETTSVSILSTLIEDDLETRKLSVGGNITLHELTKSILELFTYDRYGGLDNGLGIDSDSRYTMSLPYGIELSNPDANSQSGKSSEDLRVAGAKLGDRDTFYITFPCADDLSKTYCKFSIRVENIAITSSNDDTDILLTDEDNDSNLLGSILSDSYLNSYDGDNDSDDAPSEEDNATQSGDDMLNLLDSNLLLSI